MTQPIPPGASGLANSLGGTQTSWEDRVREGAYTAPETGTRIRFDFEDLSREVSLRGTAWEFPGVNDAYIQRTGFGARRYPIRCYFAGKDHDLIATAFESALLEHGAGRLEHPLHGQLTVVPFGDITRRDDLKQAANQTVVEVTFWTTLGAVYPSSRADPQNEIAAALVGFDVAAAQRFEAAMRLPSTLEKSASKATIRGLLQDVSSALTGASDAVESVNQEFREIQSTINFGLDVLIGQPLQLAQQISNLIKAPGRAIAGINSRLDDYDALFDKIFGSRGGRTSELLGANTSIPQRTTRISNDFHTADLSAMSTVAGAVTAVTRYQFQTKPEVIEAADRVVGLFDRVVAWREGGYASLAAINDVGSYQVDTGEGYRSAQELVALTVGYLVRVSFTLVPERRVVLDRPRSIIDLSAELYGKVDSKLDLLINSNALTGDEILEVPRGRMIRYYPDA